MITWRKIDKDITVESIKKVEDLTQIKIPSDLTKLILDFNHGRPDKEIFDTNKEKGHVLGALLNFNSDKQHSDNVVNVYNNIKSELPTNFFPFASDPGGNYLCVEIEDEKIKGIYFWNHEMQFEIEDKKVSFQNGIKNFPLHNIEFISNSLIELLDKLYNDDELPSTQDEGTNGGDTPPKRWSVFDGIDDPHA